MIPKSWTKYAPEGAFPIFSSVSFPRECGGVSDEHDIVSMENRYKGNWSLVMVDDFCWNLKRDAPEMLYKIRSKY